MGVSVVIDYGACIRCMHLELVAGFICVCTLLSLLWIACY